WPATEETSRPVASRPVTTSAAMTSTTTSPADAAAPGRRAKGRDGTSRGPAGARRAGRWGTEEPGALPGTREATNRRTASKVKDTGVTGGRGAAMATSVAAGSSGTTAATSAIVATAIGVSRGRASARATSAGRVGGRCTGVAGWVRTMTVTSVIGSARVGIGSGRRRGGGWDADTTAAGEPNGGAPERRPFLHSPTRRDPLARRVPTFRELLHHLSVERRDIVRFTAGHQPLIHDYLFIDPLGARVAQVGLDRRERSDPPALQHIGIHEHPGTVADRRNRLAFVEEGAHELNGLAIHPQLIGVHHAPGQQQRVEVAGICGVDVEVDREFLPPVRPVPCLHGTLSRGDDLDLRPRLPERFHRLGQLHLLEPLFDQHRDPFALEITRHRNLHL